jgi:FixJ family two-component response regulator
MTKELLVSVVEDDRSFRESMRRLMRSLGYAAEALHRRPISSHPLVSAKRPALSPTSTCLR